MKKKIRLAAIYYKIPDFPEKARPYNENFDEKFPRLYVEKNVEKVCSFLHKAGEMGVDMVCTDECFERLGAFTNYLDHPDLFSSLVEEIPGPISKRLGEIARKYDMNIVANYHEREADKFYNTSVLINRKGKIVGKYRKVHLPPGEKWRISAGKEFTVLESDIGKIGFATCYDILFPEHCRAMALNGADIIVHQTMGWGFGRGQDIGEALVRTRAHENSVYMVVGKKFFPRGLGKSCIIDNDGKILAEAGGMQETVVAAEISPDFDRNREEHFGAFLAGTDSFRAQSLLEREPSLYSVISSKNPPVLEQYKDIELQTTPEKIKKVFIKWKEYKQDVENNRPAKWKLHW